MDFHQSDLESGEDEETRKRPITESKSTDFSLKRTRSSSNTTKSKDPPNEANSNSKEDPSLNKQYSKITIAKKDSDDEEEEEEVIVIKYSTKKSRIAKSSNSIANSSESKPKAKLPGFASFSTTNPFDSVAPSSRSTPSVSVSTPSSPFLKFPSTESKPNPAFSSVFGVASNFSKPNDENCSSQKSPSKTLEENPAVSSTPVVHFSGEENEVCVLELRAKLYRLHTEEQSSNKKARPNQEHDHMKFGSSGKSADQPKNNQVAQEQLAAPLFSWKEMGFGPIHVNKPKDPGAGVLPRLVMRRDGVMNVMLNCFVWPGLPVEKASEKSLRFTVTVEGKTATYLMKFPRQDQCTKMLLTVEQLKREGINSAQ